MSEVRLRFYRTAPYSLAGKVVQVFQHLNWDRFPGITHVALLYEYEGVWVFADIGLNYFNVSVPPVETQWHEDWSLGEFSTTFYPQRLTRWLLRKGDMTLFNSPRVNCVSMTKEIVWGNEPPTNAVTPSELYEYVLSDNRLQRGW